MERQIDLHYTLNGIDHIETGLSNSERLIRRFQLSDMGAQYIMNVYAEEKDEEQTTEEKDETKGYEDRLAGYYDKWYRYNRKDNGTAYDRGCVRAVDSGKCSEDFFTLIECKHM